MEGGLGAGLNSLVALKLDVAKVWFWKEGMALYVSNRLASPNLDVLSSFPNFHIRASRSRIYDGSPETAPR
jgi:hypothetical protein